MVCAQASRDGRRLARFATSGQGARVGAGGNKNERPNQADILSGAPAGWPLEARAGCDSLRALAKSSVRVYLNRTSGQDSGAGRGGRSRQLAARLYLFRLFDFSPSWRREAGGASTGRAAPCSRRRLLQVTARVARGNKGARGATNFISPQLGRAAKSGRQAGARASPFFLAQPPPLAEVLEVHFYCLVRDERTAGLRAGRTGKEGTWRLAFEIQISELVTSCDSPRQAKLGPRHL